MALEYYKFFLNSNPLLYKVTYLQGVPNLNESFAVKIIPETNSITFLDNVGKKRFEIKKEDLVDVFVEDQSSIESRISISRLLLVGVFAFAWKKRKSNPLSFIIFDYKNEFGTNQQMIIQSDHKDSFQYFTNVKYNLYKFWKEIEANPNLLHQLEELNTSHKIKEEENNKRLRIGCLVILVLFLIFILYIFN